MDKRTAEGRHFKELSQDDKVIFLLEKIYNHLNENTIIHDRTNQYLRFISSRLIELQKLQNKNQVWNVDYIKQITRSQP